MNGVGDPSLVRDTMETIKAIFGDNILLVDYKNDIGKEAVQELVKDGVISILEMSENYENTVNRRMSKKDKKPKKTKPPTLPNKTYTATNIKYELEGVSKCEDSCTRIFKNALEDHTDEYFSNNPDIMLVRNTVTVTDVSISIDPNTGRRLEGSAVIITLDQKFEVKGETSDINPQELGTASMTTKKDQQDFTGALKDSNDSDLENISGVTVDAVSVSYTHLTLPTILLV